MVQVSFLLRRRPECPCEVFLRTTFLSCCSPSRFILSLILTYLLTPPIKGQRELPGCLELSPTEAPEFFDSLFPAPLFRTRDDVMLRIRADFDYRVDHGESLPSPFFFALGLSRTFNKNPCSLIFFPIHG